MVAGYSYGSPEEDLARRLTEEIIDVILASPLNVDVIPDDVERDLYVQLFCTLREQQWSSCFRGCWCKVKSFFGCR